MGVDDLFQAFRIRGRDAKYDALAGSWHVADSLVYQLLVGEVGIETAFGGRRPVLLVDFHNEQLVDVAGEAPFWAQGSPDALAKTDSTLSRLRGEERDQLVDMPEQCFFQWLVALLADYETENQLGFGFRWVFEVHQASSRMIVRDMPDDSRPIAGRESSPAASSLGLAPGARLQQGLYLQARTL